MSARVFTKDVGKRFKKGDVRDYPAPTWSGISRSLKLKLDKFSQPVVTEAPAQRSVS